MTAKMRCPAQQNGCRNLYPRWISGSPYRGGPTLTASCWTSCWMSTWSTSRRGPPQRAFLGAAYFLCLSPHEFFCLVFYKYASSLTLLIYFCYFMHFFLQSALAIYSLQCLSFYRIFSCNCFSGRTGTRYFSLLSNAGICSNLHLLAAKLSTVHALLFFSCNGNNCPC